MIRDKQISLVKFLREITGYNVYNYVPADAKFPYIHIAKVSRSDWSGKSWNGSEINFKLDIYDNNTTNGELLDILDLINEEISKTKIDTNIQIMKVKKPNQEIVFNKTYGIFQASFNVIMLIHNEDK